MSLPLLLVVCLAGTALAYQEDTSGFFNGVTIGVSLQGNNVKFTLTTTKAIKKVAFHGSVGHINDTPQKVDPSGNSGVNSPDLTAAPWSFSGSAVQVRAGASFQFWAHVEDAAGKGYDSKIQTKTL